MAWIITLLYIIGAVIAHCIIYRSADEIEPETANITCMLWPVAAIVCGILYIENIFNRSDYENHKE